ncbi:Helicase superfamily 1/2 ATP-binding domain [Arabidopsis suecica]|uniref:Helicase superfamily 1/2 ATP-binding domain n=1 Tax=Arabidopsis suecica TaxID=45249 RepID=A0A8T2AN83_ARASU|nr:Helicase superfamily 1/2 ATP-binding domain [Arabidopsis suecica]
MGRRKQSKPQRSGGLITQTGSESDIKDLPGDEAEGSGAKNVEDIDKPYYVNICLSSRISEQQQHFDIAEVVLTNFSLRERLGSSSTVTTPIEVDHDLDCSLRFRLCNVTNFVDRIKLGHWPVLSSSDITLELVDNEVSDDEAGSVIWSASFDGPGEGVSGLAHLASIKFLTLRLMPGNQGLLSPRVRVEMLQQAFDSCDSLLENTRQIWKKSMIHVMSWLRPEVMTSEARYGTRFNVKDIESSVASEAETLDSSKQSGFDAAVFYEAIKPSKTNAMLGDDITDLLPELRPYQRRAAYWMVQRERGDPITLGNKEDNQFISPLSISVGFLDSATKMFFNPFSGNISLAPEYFSPRIPGGILADEMGLGKTVELLACIFSHRKPAEDEISVSNGSSVTDDLNAGLRRLKRERVECICGAVSESRKYKGVWVQCDLCDAWQHADCVGYSPKGKGKKASQHVDEKVSQKKSKKDATEIIDREGEYICQMCSELLQVTASPISTGATLIVCPAPILPQWHSEITRHTRLGSLVTCIYEGVRNASLSEEPMIDITELLNADIVLTTYDVLKEDLTHDFDRHDGDRHCLRFQKRYPVIPTPLTRIFWWRICLDEAQMVESNAAAATEMALRLYTKHRWCITGTPIQRKLDDLFGLLKFLKANPFDVSRWWIEVIRDPYERRDTKAMEFTHKFFKQVMWRSSKVHVADELQLPPQEECVSWLKFSAIEEHFYSRQHETCVSYAREVIETLKRDILKRGHTSSDNPLITHAEAAKLLNSLLKLRQACCHPQVGSSGLRSLQQTPMTMEEILMVLVKKTQKEGEEALRVLIVALNGIAAIAMLKQEFSEAVSLYKEALSITEEHAEDFRLDPLLNIHILHNLAEILPMAKSYGGKLSASGRPEIKIDVKDDDHHRASKRQRINELESLTHDSPDSGLKKDGEYHEECKTLNIVCDTLKVKYLSAFNSKLSAAQQEFKKSYNQVSESLSNMGKQRSVWWLDALQLAEQNKDFSGELTRKIEEILHGSLNNSSSSRASSRFRTIHGMKLHLQTCMDTLESSRKKVIDRILEIDQTMEKPKLEDIERISNCKYCNKKDDGPTCTHCELDELFQEYEARLFRLNKSRRGVMELAAAEETVHLRKKRDALNLFFIGLSSRSKDLNAPRGDDEEPTKRNAGDTVVVSKSPSETEIVLGVIRNHCKTHLDRESKLAATKHLHTLEVMRKEYAHARALARAQAQLLRAYDEINMSTMRLQLRESEDDTSIYALSRDELDVASVLNTNDKFMAQSSVLSIKGKLRYLKGLIKSKQKQESESPDLSSPIRETLEASDPVEQEGENLLKRDEACPICQEILRNQKMVFQCGHSTCCNCFFAMTERKSVQETLQKWVMCPICRQHTDVRNIAYADDRRNSSSSDQDHKDNEASLVVQGSYGTKIEAVTRRILWIKSSDPQAKVLVFSSWNDVLDVLQHAFAANSITCIRMKGGRKSQTAISKFKGSEKETQKTNQKEENPIQVLLLLVQHGANGLNLLEAQHVILVEPLLNPAAEAQAVGRVHRIGQEKPTLVHRFLVTGTVEESIYKLNRNKNTNLSSFSSRNTKNQDQQFLTLRDLESLFASPAAETAEMEENPGERQENLRDLPPSVAAALAAERRMKESSASSSATNAS